MPRFDADWPFQMHSFRENEDIQLLTTHYTPLILDLIEFFDLGKEIAEDTKILFDPPKAEKKTVVIALCSKPEKGANYAYAALLECDLCGVRNGFFALFKSLSGDIETLSKESNSMFELLNRELKKREDLVLNR
jgi:hypothetical protein